MILRLVVLLFALLTSLPLYAQGDTIPAAPTTAATVRYDSSAVAVRSVETAVRPFLADDEFAYDRQAVVSQSLWTRIKQWLWDKLMQILPGDASTLSTILDVVLYLLVGGALLYVVFRLTGMSFTGVLGRTARPVVTTEALEEDIHALDFDRLIEEAVQQEQYRKAVRLLYLRSLKELADRGYIHWSIDKTNRDYLGELPPSDMRRTFEQLTLMFEYIWYGDFPMDRPLFDRAHELFRSFSTQTAERV